VPFYRGAWFFSFTQEKERSTIVQDVTRAQSVTSEEAILVALITPARKHLYDQEEPLEELAGLADAAGCEVVDTLIQRRASPIPSTYIGSGKVEELKEIVTSTDASVVIFDNDLSPGQIRNLEKTLDVKVLDRTELILDIFATRAQTRQAKLAVELAQYEYAMPRLKRMWTHLSRQQFSVGMRGPGETQLETDRRLAEKRILDLKKQLDLIGKRKSREVAAREGVYTVSLVGYTNAGKSTLMNQMTGADVLEQDLLFATLDTRTRRWHLPGWGPVLLSDTVGFIRDLPHHLVESFKATLEEACNATLLLHVADASSPEVELQIAAANAVLKELGIDQKDTLLILNKTDLIEEQGVLNHLLEKHPNALPVSAWHGEGIQDLTAAVSDALSANFVKLRVTMPVSNGRMLAYLAKHGEILSEQYESEEIIVRCRIPRAHLGRIRKEEVAVEEETS